MFVRKTVRLGVRNDGRVIVFLTVMCVFLQMNKVFLQKIYD